MVAFGLLEGSILFGAAAIAAWIAVTVVVRLRGWDQDQESAGPQNIHFGHTSRLGGVAVIVGYVAALAIALDWQLVSRLPAVPLLLAAVPICVVGLWEDVAHRASPTHRLLAAFVSAALAGAFAKGIVPRVDLPYLDHWLAYLPVALPLTFFMVAGACNAFNIIDGNHGLAAGTALLLFLGIAIVAWNAGDRIVVAQAAGMAGALTGFLLWNYPAGKVFLGDAGAYFVGFIYAEISIQLIARNPGISAWFVIALAAYPIVEMLYSIYRRKFVRHTAAMQPDVLHLHSLIYVCVLCLAQRPKSGDRRHAVWAKAYPGGERRRCVRGANARVAPLLWLHGGVCLVNAWYFHATTAALISFVCLYAIAYVVCYRSAVRISERNSHGVTAESNRFAEVPASEQRRAVEQPPVPEALQALDQPQAREQPRAMATSTHAKQPAAPAGAPL